MGAVAAGINHFDLPTVVNYIESHDEAAHQGRISVLADGSDPDGPYANARARVAMALVLFSAGIPMLLQGQELLESRPFGDSMDKRIRWELREDNAPFFLFAKDAVRLRRTQPALRSSSGQNVFHVNDGANVLALHRYAGGGDDLVVVVSLNNSAFDAYQLGFPLGGDWFEVLNGDAAAYGGENRGNGGRITVSGPGMHGFGQSAAIVIPPSGVLVFARGEIPAVPQPGFVRGDCNGDGLPDISDAVKVLLHLFAGAAGGDCPAACDAGGDGALGVSDPIFLLSFLFRMGPPPPAPHPACGAGTSALECVRDCDDA
jgi:hypothetical protein